MIPLMKLQASLCSLYQTSQAIAIVLCYPKPDCKKPTAEDNTYLHHNIWQKQAVTILLVSSLLPSTHGAGRCYGNYQMRK